MQLTFYGTLALGTLSWSKLRGKKILNRKESSEVASRVGKTLPGTCHLRELGNQLLSSDSPFCQFTHRLASPRKQGHKC